MKRKYRVKSKRVWWLDGICYFPQEKIGWFPIWFNVEDLFGEDNVFFSKEQDALDWIEIVKKNRS